MKKYIYIFKYVYLVLFLWNTGCGLKFLNLERALCLVSPDSNTRSPFRRWLTLIAQLIHCKAGSASCADRGNIKQTIFKSVHFDSPWHLKAVIEFVYIYHIPLTSSSIVSCRIAIVWSDWTCEIVQESSCVLVSLFGRSTWCWNDLTFAVFHLKSGMAQGTKQNGVLK